jgi:hypothetical protein
MFILFTTFNAFKGFDVRIRRPVGVGSRRFKSFTAITQTYYLKHQFKTFFLDLKDRYMKFSNVRIKRNWLSGYLSSGSMRNAATNRLLINSPFLIKFIVEQVSASKSL